jgi:hypothetical protein
MSCLGTDADATAAVPQDSCRLAESRWAVQAPRKRIHGHASVDFSLFPEGGRERDRYSAPLPSSSRDADPVTRLNLMNDAAG